MFGLSWAELAVASVVALLVLGPEKLPKAMRGLGRAYGQLHKLLDDFRQASGLMELKEAARREALAITLPLNGPQNGPQKSSPPEPKEANLLPPPQRESGPGLSATEDSLRASGPDTGPEASPDTGPEASPDTVLDKGPEAGQAAWADASSALGETIAAPGPGDPGSLESLGFKGPEGLSGPKGPRISRHPNGSPI